jgi:hypothetical protein
VLSIGTCPRAKILKFKDYKFGTFDFALNRKIQPNAKSKEPNSNKTSFLLIKT